jgi:hypothetical protein
MRAVIFGIIVSAVLSFAVSCHRSKPMPEARIISPANGSNLKLVMAFSLTAAVKTL